jgi:hypothetical protein
METKLYIAETKLYIAERQRDDIIAATKRLLDVLENVVCTAEVKSAMLDLYWRLAWIEYTNNE